MLRSEEEEEEEKEELPTLPRRTHRIETKTNVMMIFSMHETIRKEPRTTQK